MSPTTRNFLLALIITGGILNYADRQIIAILKPVLEKDLGWSDSDYGGLVSAFQFSAAMAFLFVGWLVDRIGLVRANPLAVGSWSLAAIAHGFATTLPQFLAARMALGATEAMGTPAAIKTIAAVFAADRRPLALGMMNAAASLGAVLIPLAIPFLALSLGWRLTFIVVGAAGFVWVAAWYLTLRGQAHHFQDAAPSSTAASGSWVEALRDRRTWAIAGAKALSDQVWWFLLFWSPDLLHKVYHLDMGGFAVPLACIYVAAGVGALLGGRAYNRLLAAGWGPDRARKLIFFTCGLLVLPVPLAANAGSVWYAVVLLGWTLAAHQAFSVNLFSLITEVAPSSRLGLVTGIGALSGNLAGMLILQTTGWVLAAGYGYLPMLLLASVSYLAAFGWLRWHLWTPRTARRLAQAGA